MIFTHRALLCLEFMIYLQLAMLNAWKMAGQVFNIEGNMETQKTISPKTGLIMSKDLEVQVCKKYLSTNHQQLQGVK